MKFPPIPFMISFLAIILISCNKHIIPPSLAIAQAIDESGWGTSHFAIEGNCLFGQHASLHSNGKYIPVKGSTIINNE